MKPPDFKVTGFKIATKPIEMELPAPDMAWRQTLSDGRVVRWRDRDGDELVHCYSKVKTVGYYDDGDPITHRSWYVNGTGEQIVPQYAQQKHYFMGRPEFSGTFTCGHGEMPNRYKMFNHVQDDVEYISIFFDTWDWSEQGGKGTFVCAAWKDLRKPQEVK